MSLAKKKIKFNFSVLVAFFVYSYAKLGMLEFYYDFLDKVLPRDAFEMIEMDTGGLTVDFSPKMSNLRFDLILINYSLLTTCVSDTLYFALSHKTLEEAIPASRKQLFNQIKSNFLALCPDPHHPEYDYRIPW